MSALEEPKFIPLLSAGERRPDRASLEQEQAALMLLAHDAIIVRDADSMIRFWNPGAEETYGWSNEEALGKLTHNLLQTQFPVSKEEVDRALFQEGIWEGELVHTRRDGARIIVASRQALRRDADGNPAEILEINRDITQRKRAEEALRQSEERNRAVVETANQAFVAMDAEGKISDWNQQAEVTFGWSRAEAIGRPLSDTIIPPQHREAHKKGLQHFLATGEGPVLNRRFEMTALHRDGHEFPVELTIAATRLGPTYIFNSFLHDISARKQAEESLRESEERFRLLVEGVQDYAIFRLDPEGRVSSWNIGAERIKGYKASEIIGKHFSCFDPEEDLRSGKPERELKIAVKEGRFEDEGWRIRKDGSRFWANVILTALRDGAGRLRGFGKVTGDTTERMQAHEALRKANEELKREIAERSEAERKLQDSEQALRELSGHLLRTQDAERRRIGRDLHDSVGQYLAVLKMVLESVRSEMKWKEEETDQQLAECVHLAAEAMKEVRTISYLLYPPMLEETGLRSAIPWYLEGFAKRSGMEITSDIPTNFGRLAPEVELAIFRVLQESLTNVHRHSGSPAAHIRMVMQDGRVSLEVEDKGKGIPTGILDQFRRDSLGTLGVGLRGMNERVRQLGGKLEVSSSAQGTTVRATVPCGESSSVATTSS